MKTFFSFFRELKDFYKFFFRTNENEREIVFYSEDASYYTYFEGIIEYLTIRNNLKISYITSDASDFIFSAKKKNIQPFYIKHLLEPFVLLLHAKIFLVTMPDLNLFYIKRSKHVANHIYIFHTIGSYFHINRHHGLFYYDTIFCVGPHHIKELRREEELYKRQPRELVSFGYYRLEKIRTKYLECVKNQTAKEEPVKNKWKAKILIAPGGGLWKTKETLLDLCGSKLIRILLESRYEVVLRPHPLTRKISPRFLDSLYAEFSGYENFSSEEDAPTFASLFDADILIGDWSGITYEFAFGTEKPVLFVDVPMKKNNPFWRDFGIEPIDIAIRNRIGKVIDITEIESVDTHITKLLEEKEEYKKEIAKAREEYIFNFGDSSRIGAQYIRDFIS